MIIIFNFVSSLWSLSLFFFFNQSLIYIIIIFLIFRTRGRDKLPSKFQFPLRAHFSLNLRMCQRRKSTVNYPRCCFSTTNGSNPVLWRRLIHHVTGYPSAPLVATVASAGLSTTPTQPPNYYKWNCPFELRETNEMSDARDGVCVPMPRLLYSHYCYHKSFFFLR